MNVHMKLSEILMDELPEEHPWKGNIRGLVEMLIANGVTINDTSEQAFQNGYSAGYAAGRRSAGESKYGIGNAYGNWINCKAKDIQEAKRLLAREMLCMMEKLAETDEFWEITNLPVPTVLGEDVRIGYKIIIPYMDVQ